ADDLAVGRPSGRKDETLAFLHRIQYVARAIDIRRRGAKWIGRARRITNDRGKMEHPIAALDNAPKGIEVAHVALDQLQVGMPGKGAHVLSTVHEIVEDRDVISLIEEHRGQYRAHVAGAARDQNFLHAPLLS